MAVVNPIDIVKAWQEGQRVDSRAANEKYLAKEIRLLLPNKEPLRGKDVCSRHFERVAHGIKKFLCPNTSGPYVFFLADGNRVAHRFRWHAETIDGKTLDFFVFNFYVIEVDGILHFEEHYDSLLRSAQHGEIQGFGEPPADPDHWILPEEWRGASE